MKKCDSKYSTCLYYSVNALARAVTKMADEEFSKTGLQSTSYAFLIMTVNENPGVHPKEIAESMQLTASTVTRLIEKMEAKGFLYREHSGRITEVFPTEKGLKLDSVIKEAWLSFNEKYTKLIGENESKELTENIFKAYNKII